ncbi:MAG: DUF3800 domain-containing protein [Thermoanaerobaculia bacterium]
MAVRGSIFAYVDEYGDPSLDTTKQGVTTFFIVTAVLVEAHALESLKDAVEGIRRTHFQTGEMKSSGVGGDDDRRLGILNDLEPLPWTFYSVAVDKRGLSKTGGFIYKQPFLKFLSGRLYKQLYDVFAILEVRADQHGSGPFMDSFKKYVSKSFKPDLFSKGDFTFVDSKNEVLVQLADFVSGSIARVLDPKKQGAGSEAIAGAVRRKAVGIQEWPPRRRSVTLEPAPSASAEEDRLVADQSLGIAMKFIEEHDDDTGIDTMMQVEAVKFLMFQYQHVSPTKYVSKEALIQLIGHAVNERVSENTFRNPVVAKLRDAGVLIASTSRGGYKIPSTVGDLLEFVELAQTIVEPMLSRVDRARQRVLLASNGKIDICGEPRFADLRLLLDARAAV